MTLSAGVTYGCEVLGAQSMGGIEGVRRLWALGVVVRLIQHYVVIGGKRPLSATYHANASSRDRRLR